MFPDISRNTVGNTICKCRKLNCLISVLVLRGQFLPEVLYFNNIVYFVVLSFVHVQYEWCKLWAWLRSAQRSRQTGGQQ